MKRFALAALLPLAAPLLGACGGDDEPAPCSDSGRHLGAVITFATFARQLDDATAEGVDVDGMATGKQDEVGCFQQDFTAPDGRGGIDNQFATLLPLIEDFVGSENIDAILEGAIANGQLLLVLDVGGVDDPLNDSCVDVTLGAGTGTPLLDTEGLYEAYQTFGFDAVAAPISHLPGGRIDNGVLDVGPGDLTLPVRILDADFNLVLRSGRFHLDVTPDALGGVWLSGYAGGGIAVDDFSAIIAGLNISDDIMMSVVPLLAVIADLGQDETGACSQVSAALRIETTPAFVQQPP
jgi:hypothetical protein